MYSETKTNSFSEEKLNCVCGEYQLNYLRRRKYLAGI